MGDAGSMSPTIRFLGFMNPPPPEWNLNMVELDESDVVWNTPQAEPAPRRKFSGQKSGLSALLSSEDHSARQHLNRSVSDAWTVPVPPAPASVLTAQPLNSAPIKVPAPFLGRSMSDRFFDGRYDDEDGGEEEMLPPHEMVARAQKKASLSVIEGVGRTLKGRDLRRVRNAVWQQTGFLD